MKNKKIRYYVYLMKVFDKLEIMERLMEREGFEADFNNIFVDDDFGSINISCNLRDKNDLTIELKNKMYQQLLYSLDKEIDKINIFIESMNDFKKQNKVFAYIIRNQKFKNLYD